MGDPKIDPAYVHTIEQKLADAEIRIANADDSARRWERAYVRACEGSLTAKAHAELSDLRDMIAAKGGAPRDAELTPEALYCTARETIRSLAVGNGALVEDVARMAHLTGAMGRPGAQSPAVFVAELFERFQGATSECGRWRDLYEGRVAPDGDAWTALRGALGRAMHPCPPTIEPGPALLRAAAVIDELASRANADEAQDELDRGQLAYAQRELALERERFAAVRRDEQALARQVDAFGRAGMEAAERAQALETQLAALHRASERRTVCVAEGFEDRARALYGTLGVDDPDLVARGLRFLKQYVTEDPPGRYGVAWMLPEVRAFVESERVAALNSRRGDADGHDVKVGTPDADAEVGS